MQDRTSRIRLGCVLGAWMVASLGAPTRGSAQEGAQPGTRRGAADERTLTRAGPASVGNGATGKATPQPQKPVQPEPMLAGPHVGPVEEALVGLEVVNIANGGMLRETRHGNGFVLRCDGFVLAPSGLLSPKMSNGQVSADRQAIVVVLHPGTKEEKRVLSSPVRYQGHYLRNDLVKYLDYLVVKLVEPVHTPALRTLLPDTLKSGEEIQVVWAPWDPTANRFTALQRRTVPLGDARQVTAILPSGTLLFAQPQQGLPQGAVVIGPEGLAVGLVTGREREEGHSDFLSLSVLGMATNCVTPVPTPDSAFFAGSKTEGNQTTATTADTPVPPSDSQANGLEEAPANAAGQTRGGPANGAPAAPRTVEGMVAVPGGPVQLPTGLLEVQPDMERATAACVAPFLTDKYEVTNAEYHAFLQTLSKRDRESAVYFPRGWAHSDAPYPDELAQVPVLGVSLAGAQAYARWKGKRLPTPYEWVLAAFGPKGGAEMPDWVQRYIADRQQTWKRVVMMHLAYMQDHPLFQMEDLYPNFHQSVNRKSPRIRSAYFYYGFNAIPWMVLIDGYMPYSEWSQKVVREQTEHLWTAWKAPPYVLPVGSRGFDASPYGAMDMIMNASELVMPSPLKPYDGEELCMEIGWRGVDTRLFTDVPPEAKLFGIAAPRPWNAVVNPHPLSRLLFRGIGDFSSAKAIMNANYTEAVEMLAPIGEWELHMTSMPVTAMAWGQEGWDITDIAANQLWQEAPRHYHQEMGCPPALGPVDTRTQSIAMINKSAYLQPRGFRCVR